MDCCFIWKLKQELGLMENAMTSYDNYPYQYYVNTHDAPYIENAFYVDLIPTNEDTLVKKIVLKEKNSDMTIDTLVKKFNYLLQVDGEKVARMTANEKTSQIRIIMLQKNDLVLVCSKAFHEFLNHRTAAVHDEYDMRYWAVDYKDQFFKEWSFSIYRKKSHIVGDVSSKVKVLTPHFFKSVEESVYHLNQVVDNTYIHFSVNKDILYLAVAGKDITVILDDTLRDILGFDQNTFTSGNTVKATAKISLTRRINYFQIYTNIIKNVRVGDTEAPLLTMIPFNPRDCSILSERHFKKLHYVELKSNYIPQIDISIYDDAGALVPFHKDAVTSMTLHFRRKV